MLEYFTLLLGLIDFFGGLPPKSDSKASSGSYFKTPYSWCGITMAPLFLSQICAEFNSDVAVDRLRFCRQFLSSASWPVGR